MFARLRGWFWWRLYALAEERWLRVQEDAYPPAAIDTGAGEYRWVVDDPAYAPVWSAPDGAVAGGEPVPSRRDPEQTFIPRR